MARKTADVAQIAQMLNSALSHPTLAATQAARTDVPTLEDAWRAGICFALDAVLSTTGNYNGFSYLDGWPAARENQTEHRRHYNFRGA